MNNATLTGSDENWIDKQPIKTYNEQIEIRIRRMLTKYGVVINIGDPNLLVEELCQFYEDNQKRKSS